MKEALFPLICAGLYERNFKKFPELTPKQWAAVVSMAHRQTVTGILRCDTILHNCCRV